MRASLAATHGIEAARHAGGVLFLASPATFARRAQLRAAGGVWGAFRVDGERRLGWSFPHRPTSE